MPEWPDCDVCMSPMPLESQLGIYMNCCGKRICCGCFGENHRVAEVTYAKKKLEEEKQRELKEKGMKRRKKGTPKKKKSAIKLSPECAFCRTPLAWVGDNEEDLRRTKDRMDRNDARAIKQMGMYYRDGDLGLPVDHVKSVELLQRAAELGSPDALGQLGQWHLVGNMGLDVDHDKARIYLEEAAKKGYVTSRISLGIMESLKGNWGLAAKHWRISAAAGDKESVDLLTQCFQKGVISKASLEESMRARFLAWKEMQTDDRDLYVAYKRCREDPHKKNWKQYLDLAEKQGKAKDVDIILEARRRNLFDF